MESISDTTPSLDLVRRNGIVDPITITYLVLAGLIVLFVANIAPVELVALGGALTLWATGVLELDQTLAGFGDPAIALIAGLFVVSEGLDATGVTTWAGQVVLGRAGDSQRRLITYVLLLVAFLTALISVNGAVAALVPMVVMVSLRSRTAPSRILMPLAFGAHAGSLLALTGTPVNVLVSEAAEGAGAGTFGFLEFALVGVPLVAGTIAIVVVFGSRLLPERTPASLTPDLSAHARTLGLQYLDDHRVFRMLVAPGSAAIGRSDASIALAKETIGLDDDDIIGGFIGVQLQGVGALHHPDEVEEGDVLLFRGAPTAVGQVARLLGLIPESKPFSLTDDGELIDRALGVAEVVIPPRSALIGQKVFPGMVTDSGDLILLAVQRRGEDLGSAASTLGAGDTLLLQGQWAALDEHVPSDPNVLMVDAPEQVRRQTVPLGPGSREAIVIVVAMVAMLATGVVPPAVAALLAAMAMVILRVLTTEQAYRGIAWTTIVLVAAMIPLSTAMTQTGAADQLATGLVDLVGDSSPYLFLLGLFVLTAIMGQLISNMATALIVIPIAVSASAELGVSVRPVMMCVTVAAAAALLTPVATASNLMVMGPGGYRFGDYWKLGLPLMALYGLVAVLLVPAIWSF